MKKLIKLLPVIALAVSIQMATGCGPTGDKNSTDDNNGVNEGETDSTKMPGFGAGQQADTISMGDTSAMGRDTMKNTPR